MVLTTNRADPSPAGPFEAWAYRGELNFQTAQPVTFGVGENIRNALTALEQQLRSRLNSTTAAPRSTCLWMGEREHSTVLAALRLYQELSHDGKGVSDSAIDDIASNSGKLEPLNAEEIDHLCERLNVTNPSS